MKAVKFGAVAGVALICTLSTVDAQDVGLAIRETSHTIVQKFKIAWVSKSADAQDSALLAERSLQEISKMSTAVGIDTSDCREEEKTAQEIVLTKEAETLFAEYQVAEDGENKHAMELQSQYAASTGYFQQLELYREMMSSAARVEMYGTMLPALANTIGTARDSVKALCLLGRLSIHRDAEPAHKSRRRFIEDGRKSLSYSRDIFYRQKTLIDATLEYISNVTI